MTGMKRLTSILFALHWFLSFGFAAETPNWEAKIPPDAETDPIALNLAFGVKEIPNRDIVERLRGVYGIQPHSFSNLVAKVAGVEIHKVAVRRDSGKWAPPDMAGIGPFYLLRAGTNYFALTSSNFTRLFAPLTNKSEVLPYLAAREELYGNRFADIVTAGTRGLPKPPKRTEVTEVKDGFRVTLVTYTTVHIEAFFETTLHVGRDGVVTVEAPQTLLKMVGNGNGIVF